MIRRVALLGLVLLGCGYSKEQQLYRALGERCAGEVNEYRRDLCIRVATTWMSMDPATRPPFNDLFTNQLRTELRQQYERR